MLAGDVMLLGRRRAPYGATMLVGVGVACSCAAAAGVALALSPITPGRRLGYYALVCGAWLPRLAALGTLGALLGVASALRGAAVRSSWPAASTRTGGGRAHRLAHLVVATPAGWGRLALAAGLGAALLGGTCSAAVFRVARAHGLRLSGHGRARGHGRPVPCRVEVVTFAAGPGWHLQADLYRPLADAPRPTPGVVVVHGGAWRRGDKGENAPFSRWLAAEGYLVLDVQYRLVPSATWRQAVLDVHAAVAWLRRHATELEVDAARIALLGRSAGGHLALLAAYAADPADRPWRVVALYAPTDLTRLYLCSSGRHGDDLCAALHGLVGGPPWAIPEAYGAASPVARAHAAAPPTLLVHGTFDTAVPFEHSRLLQDVLARQGVPVELVRIPFARHVFDLIPEGLAMRLTRAVLLRFLEWEPSSAAAPAPPPPAAATRRPWPKYG